MEKHNACQKGIDWVLEQNETDPVKLVKLAIKTNDQEILDYANWGICEILKHRHKSLVRYAVYAAEKVLHLYEEKYPRDMQPRQAIQAAKKVIKANTKENRDAAGDAAWAAGDAAGDARAAAGAARDAAWSAGAAAWAAGAAAGAARDAQNEELKRLLKEHGM